MFRTLLTGIPVMVLCLVMQAVFVTICLRRYVRFEAWRGTRISLGWDIVLLTMVMLLMMLSNFAQTGIWAGLFLLLGEFDEPAKALYFSAVNFATLGYGDIVLSPRWRLLGPLEAANGVLMFGVSTAVMTAAVADVIKTNMAEHRARESP